MLRLNAGNKMCEHFSGTHLRQHYIVVYLGQQLGLWTACVHGNAVNALSTLKGSLAQMRQCVSASHEQAQLASKGQRTAG